MPLSIFTKEELNQKVSTSTYTVKTNCLFNLEKIYDKIEVYPYKKIKTRRGRRVKNYTAPVQPSIPYGSFIYVNYMGQSKGTDIKCKCPTDNEKTCTRCIQKLNMKKWFGNSFTVVIMLDKFINFKVCSNGTFQMTGCKNFEHAKLCVQTIWNIVKTDPSMYSNIQLSDMKDQKPVFDAIFVTVMRNIVINLGFCIDREKLHNYIIYETDYLSLLEMLDTKYGYTGVNIKIPYESNNKSMVKRVTIYSTDQDWPEYTPITFDHYVSLLEEKKQKEMNGEQKFITFLTFQSGKLTISGNCEDSTYPIYKKFIEMINDGYEQIKETIE